MAPDLLQMSLSDDHFLQSSLYATSTQGCPNGADDYLNAVVEFTWPGTVSYTHLKTQENMHTK